MNANVLNNVNVFANEFVSTIIGGNEQASNGYEWEISFHMDIANRVLSMETLLFLYDGDGEEVGHIVYEAIRNKNMRYAYTTTFSFDEATISDDNQDLKEFEEITNTINLREDGLYEKLCAYLHRYTMEQMEYGEDVDNDCPPTYKDCYSPSKIKCFMKKYGISPYVPIVVEVEDDKGMPMKYLSIHSIGFNDESNNLIVSLREY